MKLVIISNKNPQDIFQEVKPMF